MPFQQAFHTFSSKDNAFPSSFSVNSKYATVPSAEHAINCSPLALHERSKTGLIKRPSIAKRGRSNAVTQTEIARSREPIAQQQACRVFPLHE